MASTLLFNCKGCPFFELEGGSDTSTIPNDEEISIIAGFNLQKVGRVRAARSFNEPFHDRIEFSNEWLPWKVQEVMVAFVS